MFGNPSLITRIAVGKTTGLTVGLAGLLVVPFIWPEMSGMDQAGFVLWYITVGAFIGMAGVMTWHPILKLAIPWWFMGPWIGGWMNLVLTLLIHDKLVAMMTELDGALGAFDSPFWFVAEGALVGLLISFLATRFGGEGPATATPLTK